MVAVGHCAGQAGAGVPYLPFTEVLAILWSQAPDQVAEAAARHPALGLLLPAVEHPEAAVMGVTGPGRLAEAVHDCLCTVARSHPLLVVLEDVHWADDSSRDVLTLLLTRGFDAPLAMVVSYRSDDLHRRHPLQPTLAVWARLPEVTRLHLDPLPDPAMRELVRALSPADEETVAAIAARAGGNAFFAEELVASGSAVGPDLTRVLQSRFEQLDAPAQRVVRVIAVAGASIRHDLLASRLRAGRRGAGRSPAHRRSTTTRWNWRHRTATASATRWSVRPSWTTCCPASGRGFTGPSPTPWPAPGVGEGVPAGHGMPQPAATCRARSRQASRRVRPRSPWVATARR